jgi:glycosyltransferase involved in cell wall biosynthesis
MSRERLTVIVPCLDEEGAIESTANEILGLAPELPVDIHLYLIDDGSTDRTHEIMLRIARDRDDVTVYRNPTNLGLGRSVMAAWERLPGDSWATVIPGDGEIFFDSIWNFLEVRDQYDVILGYVQNPVVRTFSRRAASTAFMRVVNALYGFRHQYLNGMKMYRVRALSGLDVKSGGHAFNAELLSKAVLRDPKLRIGEVPFVWRGRSSGHSKAFKPRSILLAMREVWRGRVEVDRYREQVLVSGPSEPAGR